LSKEERGRLNELKNNEQITIKKADKGSAIVVMNTSDYVAEAERQLQNKLAYKKLDFDPSGQICKEIQDVLDIMLDKNVIDSRCHDYLSPTDPRPGRFYLLPKIHKKGCPGRPICSSNGHPTERISRFVDAHIRKFMYKQKSYVRDTQDFIKKIREIGPLPQGCILATLDVTSLYTNIPNKEGIKSIIDELYIDPDPHIISPYLIKLLCKVLTRNYFEFNGEMYLQIGGTAMGTPIAPAYASTFMGNLETKLLEGYPLKPLVWLRFLDDIFVLFTQGQDEFTKFVTYLNSKHDHIKFTVEESLEQVNFLDTTVKVDQETRRLYTTVYSKPTDTHDYLHFTSSHPDHCKTGGPKGQLLRLRRICTRDDDFNINCEKMVEHYLRRGYPKRIMKKHIYYRSEKVETSRPFGG
jgi:hypothetical protein